VLLTAWPFSYLLFFKCSGGQYKLRWLHNAQDAILGHQQSFPVTGGRQVVEVPAQSLMDNTSGTVLISVAK
jgi:hypothetical protein